MRFDVLGLCTHDDAFLCKYNAVCGAFVQCGYSLLGLGDIVIPGLLLSLMIRFDYSNGKNPFGTDSYFLYSCIGGKAHAAGTSCGA